MCTFTLHTPARSNTGTSDGHFVVPKFSFLGQNQALVLKEKTIKKLKMHFEKYKEDIFFYILQWASTEAIVQWKYKWRTKFKNLGWWGEYTPLPIDTSSFNY